MDSQIYKVIRKIDKKCDLIKLGYNDVFVTVFDKDTGRITEYNKDLKIIRSMRFSDPDIDDIDNPVWFINIYGPASTLLTTFDSNGNWTRFIGRSVAEHSSGVREEFQYYKNGQIMSHKTITKDKVCTSIYDENGTLIYVNDELKED